MNDMTSNGNESGTLANVDLDSRFKWISRSTELPDKYDLITGGAGFIGTNLAHRLLQSGRRVLLFDNFSRHGVDQNAAWLTESYPDRAHLQIADIRDRTALRRALRLADRVFHFAAQVAVTTSMLQPFHDFEVNLRGTINLLEELRSMKNPPPLVFTSTNKVYGSLPDVALRLDTARYQPVEPSIRHNGIDERRSLDFHSPYGCSKGAADQYVIDYARTYRIPTVVFRMSCIYGPHQFGTEDQGWIAHFLIKALKGEKITIYGDGMQVRDALFVEDLVDGLLLAQQHMQRLSGHAFNIGGGPYNTISLLELLELIQQLSVCKPKVCFLDWRFGDQRYYVSDVTKFSRATGWRPMVDVWQGVNRLYQWLIEESSCLAVTPAFDAAQSGRFTRAFKSA